ncbi:MAG: hypothetical protein LH478_07520 [Chitinophagaceae bacterium]|nr:hypothetical protein [Chitinophagaceae bacterium]
MDTMLLYQGYGSADIINECKFSLLRLYETYKTHEQKPPVVIIYTDQPEAFTLYQTFLSIIIKKVSAHQIQQWKGPHNFVHLVKIEVIKDCLSQHPGKIIYTDTDTICEKPLTEIFQAISSSQVYFHEYEGTLSSPSFKKWKRFFETNTIKGMEDFSPLHIDLWNAGVIGLETAHLPLLNEVYALTNNLYSRYQKHIAEQLSFCYVFQRHRIKIKSATTCIFHYWNLKEYRQLLARFFEKNKEQNFEILATQSSQVLPQKMVAEKLQYKSYSVIKKWLLAVQGGTWSINRYKV